MREEILKEVYRLLAAMHYNEERAPLCAKVLRIIIINDMTSTNIPKIAREHFEPPTVAGSVVDSQRMFKQMNDNFILDTVIDPFVALEYALKRYGPYDKYFRELYTQNVFGFIVVIKAIFDGVYARIKDSGYYFENEGIFYVSKKEYADFGLVKMPTKEYQENWKIVFTMSKKEIISSLPDVFKDSAEFFLDQYSFTPQLLKENPELRFQEKPLLKADDDTYIIAFPFFLMRCLPKKLELMLKSSKKYREIKGYGFEKIALDTLSKLSSVQYKRNIRYGQKNEFELDGLIEFNRSVWFIECKSRPPGLKSLQGDYNSIKQDTKRAVYEAEEQAERASAFSNEFLSASSKQKSNGILIILEGTYPPMNTTTAFSLAPEKSNLPRYVVNYFDLVRLVKRAKKDSFEEFLLWRTKPNPFICFDENDFWTWFTRVSRNEKLKLVFDKALKNENKIITAHLDPNKKWED